jgi:single-strand DNA-binding protein
MSFQTIILAGNLGRDPEMRYTPSGQAVTNLSVATNRQYTSNSGERVKETTWFRVSVWGKQAEACNQYLRKGSMVLVEGRLNQDPATGGPRIWTGQDGAPRASFEVTAQTVRFLSSRQGDQAASGGYAQPAGGAMTPPADDDIPF